ncbi:MAG: tripartite tricarboxylate transporter TctB family protein [Alphaproteobacteria bacterium]|nr:tripartite tricarboxylate transporter TctB family protein [Alphaproteobacteria bacterium]
MVALAAVTVWESTRWPAAASFAGDPTLLPRALAMLMVVTAVALLRFPSRPAPAEDGGAPVIGRTAAAVAATIGLATLLPYVGVVGAGIPYLLALQRLNGAAWRAALATSVAAPVLIWLAFARGLNVPLPSGSLWAALGL